MKLIVFSHKVCWRSSASPTGYATDGGFPLQMEAIAALFDETVIAVPVSSGASTAGQVALRGHNLSICPLTLPEGLGTRRKLAIPMWLMRNLPAILRGLSRADAVHTPIPGDIGTVGMLLAFFRRKPLFVRHCGNWQVQNTGAERFWKWFIERCAGGNNLMLATGGSEHAPSAKNADVRWIFSTSLTTNELKNYGIVKSWRVGHPLRLAIACRQDERKGTGVVIRSLPQVLRTLPDTILDVIGDGSDLERFRVLARECGVSDRVHFHGKLNHEGVMDVLSQAHLFCYPTRASEGFPKVVLEALACGLPVISTGVSVIPQLLAAGGGLVLDEAEPESLADAILKAVADPNEYRRMSGSAVSTAQQFTLERWRDDIGQLLQLRWGTLAARS